MRNPKNMTTLSLMLEFEQLQAIAQPTAADNRRKNELRQEIRRVKGRILCRS